MRVLPIIVVIVSLVLIIIGLNMMGPDFYKSTFASNKESIDISNAVYHFNSHPFNLSYADWAEN
jgi:hypothetical protein